MSRWTIATTIYNEYEVLRLCIESIFHRVDPSAYDKIVVFDDHSRMDTKLRQYELHLATLPKFDVVLHGKYRHLRWYQEQYYKDKLQVPGGFNYKDYDDDKPTIGHTPALWECIKRVNTEFVFLIDADIVFLEKCKDGLFERMAELFDANPKVLAIGQCIGGGGTGTSIFKEAFIADLKRKTDTVSGGYPSPNAAAFRMSTWSEYGVTPMPNPEGVKMAWPFNWIMLDLFKKGFWTQNFPLYGDKYLLHLGKGVVKRNLNLDFGSIEWARQFGFTKEMKGRYGGRYKDDKICDWYAGRHIIDMLDADFTKMLQEKFDRPFDELQEPLDERLLYDAPA